MTAVIQRVAHASVTIEGKTYGSCGRGLLILLGVARGDGEDDARLLAAKISKLRIFPDDNGKMNLSVNDISGGALVVSNFTLLANYRHGNRPDYFGAGEPAVAEGLYEYFVDCLRGLVGEVGTGKFGADMQIELVNDGPVTLVLQSDILKITGGAEKNR